MAEADLDCAVAMAGGLYQFAIHPSCHHVSNCLGCRIQASSWSRPTATAIQVPMARGSPAIVPTATEARELARSISPQRNGSLSDLPVTPQVLGILGRAFTSNMPRRAEQNITPCDSRGYANFATDYFSVSEYLLTLHFEHYSRGSADGSPLARGAVYYF